VSAVAHPEVAWVSREPAEMAVVVRRADAAAATSDAVNRLLSVPPTKADIGWTASVGPDRVEAAREMRSLREEPVYADSHARVVPAEVWAATLADVGSAVGGQQTLLGMMSPKVQSSYVEVMAARHAGSGSAAKEATLLVDVRDAACKVSHADQEALWPALVNLEQALGDADVANRAAALAYAHASASLDRSLQAVVTNITADVLEDRTRIRPDLSELHVTVRRLDAARVAIALDGLLAADLGHTALGELTDEVALRTTAWLTRVNAVGARVASTRDAIALERQVLRQVERGWNPNAEVELPVAVRIPEAQSREVDAATPAVHTPRHAVVDARSASFEGALPVLPAPAPDTDVRPEVSGPPQG
jgi:hypothetical protein